MNSISIQYYNDNAQSFYGRSHKRDLTESYNQFLQYLPKQAKILDAGCGSGRDSKYFLSQGHIVTAFDASREMCRYAKRDTGLDVSEMRFQDMDFDAVFDGVWANVSLIHVSYDETREVFHKIRNSLKQNGVFYAMYKYGNQSMQVGERQFWNMTEESIHKYLENLFEILEVWKVEDNISKIAHSPDKSLLGFIARKIG